MREATLAMLTFAESAHFDPHHVIQPSYASDDHMGVFPGGLRARTGANVAFRSDASQPYPESMVVITTSPARVPDYRGVSMGLEWVVGWRAGGRAGRHSGWAQQAGGLPRARKSTVDTGQPSITCR